MVVLQLTKFSGSYLHIPVLNPSVWQTALLLQQYCNWQRHTVSFASSSPPVDNMLSSGACLEDKSEDNQLFCALLCTTTVVHYTHTHVSSSFISFYSCSLLLLWLV